METWYKFHRLNQSSFAWPRQVKVISQQKNVPLPQCLYQLASIPRWLLLFIRVDLLSNQTCSRFFLKSLIDGDQWGFHAFISLDPSEFRVFRSALLAASRQLLDFHFNSFQGQQAKHSRSIELGPPHLALQILEIARFSISMRHDRHLQG